jgi:putative FmdB family regulatory protein
MPTYEYECDACGHRFEKFQMMTEKPKRKCPECGKRKLQRLIGTGAGIIFKGSGFYETDYKRAGKGGGGESKSESKGDAKSESSSSGGAETKSDSGSSKQEG